MVDWVVSKAKLDVSTTSRTKPKKRICTCKVGF